MLFAFPYQQLHNSFISKFIFLFVAETVLELAREYFQAQRSKRAFLIGLRNST